MLAQPRTASKNKPQSVTFQGGGAGNLTPPTEKIEENSIWYKIYNNTLIISSTKQKFLVLNPEHP